MVPRHDPVVRDGLADRGEQRHRQWFTTFVVPDAWDIITRLAQARDS